MASSSGMLAVKSQCTLCHALIGMCCFVKASGVSLQGADTVIYERLDRRHPLNEKFKDITLQHMEDFGSAGLRTLCLSYTELDPKYYDE